MNPRASWNPLVGRPRALVAAIVAVAALAFAAGLVAVYRASAPTLGLFLVPAGAFAAFGLLAALYSPSRREEQVDDDGGSPDAFAWMVAAFLLSCAVALATLDGVGLWKPLAYYLAYAFAAAVLLAQSVVSPRRSVLALVVGVVEATLLLAIATAGTQLPTLALAGADSQFHRLAIEGAAAAGTTAAITAPYDVFSGYHALPIILVRAGLGIKLAVTTANIVIAGALALASALLVSRAFGTRVAIAALALLACSPGIISTAVTISPSKEGVWALVVAAFLLVTRTRAGLGLAALFSLVAFLYHPVLGAAAIVLFVPALLFFEYLPGPRWMHRLAERLGGHGAMTEGPAPQARTRSYVPLYVMVGLVALSALWIGLASPRLIGIMLSPFTHAGSQEGALGVVRVATMTRGFLAQTLWVNLTDLWLLAPATFVIVAALLGAWRREAALLAAMLVALLGMVAFILAAGLFLAGPERFIALQDALTTMLAAPAVVLLLARVRSTGPRVALVLFIAVCLFGQASSYRSDGGGALAPDVPKQTDVLTPQLVSMVKTLQPHLTSQDALSMDYYSAFEGANFPSHNAITWWNAPVSRFSTNVTDGSSVRHGDIFTWSRQAAERSLQTGGWERASLVGDVLYDNGDLVAGVAG